MDLRVSPGLAEAMRRQGVWRDETVDACLDRWATRQTARLALVDAAGRFTWEALARTVERAAHSLRAHGVETGAVISCQLPNWNEFVILALAALRLGAVLNPIPPIYRASELRFILGLAETRALVVPGVFRGFDHAAMAAGLRKALPALEHVFVARGAPGEAALPFTALTETAWEQRDGRRPLPGMELRVVDPDGRALRPGTEGELHVRGPSLFVGYHERPQFTAEAYTPDGWFRTGGRGTLDAGGYLAITGRSKDLIIRGGEKLSPAEIESLLFAHPKVAAVAVVAMPDARLGERSCAFVVPKPGQPPTLAELTAYLETRQVARQKFPERLEIVSELPMTPSGKVQTYRLRELIAAKLAAERGA